MNKTKRQIDLGKYLQFISQTISLIHKELHKLKKTNNPLQNDKYITAFHLKYIILSTYAPVIKTDHNETYIYIYIHIHICLKNFKKKLLKGIRKYKNYL